MRRELTQEDLERMQIPRRHWGASAEGVQAMVRSGGKEEPLIDVLRRYYMSMDETVGRGVGLILMGDNGTGKTGAGCFMLKELRRTGLSCLFVESASLRDHTFSRVPFDSEMTMYERMSTVDVLFIDDVGKGVRDNKGAFELLLDQLIRTRLANMRVTMASTNMSKAQLAEMLKKSTMEAMLECMVPVPVFGPNLRRGSVSDLTSRLIGGS